MFARLYFSAMTIQQNKLTLFNCGRKYFAGLTFDVKGDRLKFPNLRNTTNSTPFKDADRYAQQLHGSIVSRWG